MSETALKTIEELGYLWDIGQLSKITTHKLNALAKRGVIAKTKALWPFFTRGTSKKTIYLRKEWLQ